MSTSLGTWVWLIVNTSLHVFQCQPFTLIRVLYECMSCTSSISSLLVSTFVFLLVCMSVCLLTSLCLRPMSRHASKLSNFVAQLCCATKLPVWLRKLPNFWRVAQLICWIETISILRQFLALSLSCDWSIVCLHVNYWFCCKLLTYYLLYISFNISYFKSKLIYR